MYNPKHFTNENQDEAFQLINEYPFATLISYQPNTGPFINHLPIILDEASNGSPVLIGHMAKRNPQWMHFKENSQATVIFNGPHAYITPRWYTSGRDVPTWNYAVVHVTGHVRVIDEVNELISVLKKMTTKFEANSSKPWEFDLPSDLLTPAALTGAITGFEITIENLEAKFKLSQNRPDVDKVSVIKGLSERGDEMGQAIVRLMKDGR